MTDAAGATATATTTTYDPYGNVTSTSGSLTTNLMFAGQYLDGESGLYYLRARYYDPSVGSFLGQDPALATTGAPYAYVGGNPVNRSDPSGMVDQSSLSRDQIMQIENQCLTWQRQSMCTQAAFCAEDTFQFTPLSGGSCSQIAQIAADNYNIVANAIACSNGGDVTLLQGYKESQAAAQEDLAEMRAAYAVAQQGIAYYNGTNHCKAWVGAAAWIVGAGGASFAYTGG